ncbi:hypothetical protein WDW89_09705 [Deltaproteobacteria bacterium TL4]
MSSTKIPSLKHYFRAYYRGSYEWSYNTLVRFLTHEYQETQPADQEPQFHNKHYQIAPEDLDEFNGMIRHMAAALYSPFNEDNSVMMEYVVDDVSIMIEGRTKPIRVCLKHPELPNTQSFRKTFYIKKSSETNPRLICSFLYKTFSLYLYNMWANDHLLITTEALGTISSQLPKGRMEELLHEPMFLREAIRCNVETRLMLLSDMYPKNFVTRRVMNKDLDARWQIIPIDFDRAFFPEKLSETRLIVPKENPDKNSPEVNLLDLAIVECFPESARKVFIREEEERLANIYLDNYQHINLLFEILKHPMYKSYTFDDLNKQFIDFYGFGTRSPLLGDLLKNSFDYLLYRLSHSCYIPNTYDI